MPAENSDRCIFCEIREGRASAYRIHEDHLSFAILTSILWLRGIALSFPGGMSGGGMT
jgi:hypothetical protein